MTDLESFLNGSKWSQIYARISLPILVRWVEVLQAATKDSLQIYTYQDLANAIGQPSHAHPIHAALGLLGHALKELQLKQSGIFRDEIPPIQMLIWSKGKPRPGDNAFNFLGISKDRLPSYSETELNSLAELALRKIVNYKQWRKVLEALNLKPLTVDLPQIESVTRSKGFGSGGESEDHRRLKLYLGSHPELLGLTGEWIATFEMILLSSDKADIVFDNRHDRARICVEVKSRISDKNDLMRGIFQCVKYRAVLDAHETYELASHPVWLKRNIRVVLVTERKLSIELQELSSLMGIKVVTVTVPESFSIEPRVP